MAAARQSRRCRKARPSHVQLQAIDPDNDPLTYSATNLPAGATLDPLDGSPDAGRPVRPGGHVRRHRPDRHRRQPDGHANHHDHGQRGQPCARSSCRSQPQSGREGTQLQFTLAAADPNGDTLTYSAHLGTAGRCDLRSRRPGKFQWTPELRAGRRLHRAVRRDRPGRAVPTPCPSDIHIDNVDRPPTLQVTNHQVVVGQPFSFQLVGSDPDLGTTLTYSAIGMPEGATLESQHRRIPLDAGTDADRRLRGAVHGLRRRAEHHPAGLAAAPPSTPSRPR